jgi:Integrase core domain
MAESFIATLKTELVHRRRFPDREVARSAIFECLEGFYNRRRLLSIELPEPYEVRGGNNGRSGRGIDATRPRNRRNSTSELKFILPSKKTGARGREGAREAQGENRRVRGIHFFATRPSEAVSSRR